MNIKQRILTVLVLALGVISSALAEQVQVTVTPKRAVLPPQVMYYLSNPGQYFTISVQNPESQDQAIFFGAEIHQLMPSEGMDIVIPAKTMPMQGIVVKANQTRILDVVDMRNMFNHVRQSDIVMPTSLFENVADGTFGMLDEGTYELILNAYKWDPHLSSPVLLSNPMLSRCSFTVCYEAAAPKWVAPMSMNDYEDHTVATLSKQAPILQWAAPAVSCNPTPIQYTYDLKVVQALPYQYPDEAIERNAVVYQKTALTVPQCLIPATVINMFSPTETYIAQITARSNNTQEGTLDYVHLQNDGKSDLLKFRVKDYSVMPDVPQVETPEEETPEEEEESDLDIFGFGGKGTPTDSLYLLGNPEIINPSFTIAEGARKIFLGSDISVQWNRCMPLGGRGERSDTLNLAYAVELFAANEYLERAEMLEREPIYTSKSLSVEKDTIYWRDIKDKVSKGDYMLIRVTPAVLNENSIAFTNDSINTIDFALVDRFAPKYFECTNALEITNTKPTTLSASELEGQTVKVGEYELVLDGKTFKAIDKKPGHFTGTGHVIWRPLKLTWKLAVKFEDIAINTDNEVYEGSVVTFEGDEPTPIDGSEVVEKLFSDWGIDNLIADTGLPYADKLQQKVDGKIASLADQLGDKISGYYNDIKAGKNKVLGLLKGDVEDVHFPLQIPDEINSTPIDLQIAKMIFTPTYASMNFFGTFALPETKVTQANQVLVFGAPRICISPESLIPEGATIALLKDFTVKDPNTDYDCTFKAPKDVIEPEDGCFVAWSGSKFEAFNMDLDMTLPHLKKVSNGKVTSENPKLHIAANVKSPINKNGQKLAGWDWIATAKLDAFEHEDLPGYTFSAGGNVVIDYSARKNVKGMPKFPKDYDVEKAGLDGADVKEWKGVYIADLSMEFPEDIKVGDGKERMKVGLYNMFIDKSGMTVEAGIVNAINYRAGENGTIGGFAFSMDTISVNFIQNQHRDFRFCGKLEIPLFKGKVNYACNIYNQKYTQKGTKQGYAYVFKTWQIENLSFDFWLADLSLDKNLTYFLLEALPDQNGELHTNCELMLGGSVDLACADKVNAKLAKLPMDMSLPGIKFCNMRLANNKQFTSTYEPEMQKTAAKEIEKLTGKDSDVNWWNEAKDIELCSGKLFLNLGQWGYASPEKKIGPFIFTLTDYKLDLTGENLSFRLGGDVTLCDELKIKAGAAVKFKAKVKNLSLDNISNISLEYDGIDFEELSLDVSVTGFSLNGTLTAVRTETDKGYKGSLTMCVGSEDLFKFTAQGGYYDHADGDNRFSYGFFQVSIGSGELGIPLGPISLTKLEGGVYFNCANTSSDFTKPDPKPKKGAIGVIFGVGLATTGVKTFSGDFRLATCLVKNDEGKYTLSTFNFTGGVQCLDGAIDAKVCLVYESNEKDRYFQLNLTVDAKADGLAGKLSDKIENVTAKLKELTGEAEEAITEAKAGLAGAFGDANGSKTELDSKEAYEKKTKGDKEGSDKIVEAGGTVSLDIRIQSKKNGEKCNLWHVYLGRPEHDQRCKFVLVDFKSKIVTVSVGANAYLCIGSELPNNGELPDLPEKVAKFLNGGSSSEEVKGDTMAEAERKRKKTLEEVLAQLQVNGGVMLGAQVWGYIDVDLGLFYGDMGATAGFDVSIVNYSGASCVNLGPGTPGYHNWYGSGQLYAYLYAKFGFNIDLGFFKKKVDLVDAGLGGVLAARMPNPSSFTGKARCKLRLLNGLVNINKTFSFECGQSCDMFLGNALDDYELFESCTIGSTNVDDLKNNSTNVSTHLSEKPIINTQTTLNKVIDVLDPTEAERIRNSAQGDNIADFDVWASRQFKFSLDGSPRLTEYLSYSKCKRDVDGKTVDLDYTISAEKVMLNLATLKPGRYYRLEITGQAKEFRQSHWKDPETYNEEKKKYFDTPWSETKVYYFWTSRVEEDSISTVYNLSDVAKVAFPMADDKSKVELFSSEYVSAPICDVKRPMISLSKQCKDRILENSNGKLYWAIYPQGHESYQSADTKGEVGYPNKPSDYYYIKDNMWIENDSVSILTPVSDFAVTGDIKKCVVKLLYQWEENNIVNDWAVEYEYTVRGKSLETIQEEATEYIVQKYGAGALLSGKLKQATVRYTVTPVGGIRNAGRASSYKVKILRKSMVNKPITYVKELYSIPVEVKNVTNSDNNWYFNQYRNDSYWGAYTATRLNWISIYDGSKSKYLRLPYGEDLSLLGTTSKTQKFREFRNGVSSVTQDPAAYLSYLANICFIGGYQIKSDKMGINTTTSKSLLIETPFAEGTYNVGRLDPSSQSLIYTGYLTLNPSLFMGPSLCKSAQTVYPLCDSGDSRLGAIVTPMGLQANIDGYLKQIRSLYKATYWLGNGIRMGTRDTENWDKKDWKDFVSFYKQTSYLSVSLGDKADGTCFTLKFPAYQIALLAYPAFRDDDGFLESIIKTNGLKHWRFIKSSGKGYQDLRIKLAVAAVDRVQTKFVDKKSSSSIIGTAIFPYSRIKLINQINYTRYRVNAWNFKDLRYTVYDGSEAATTNGFFFKTSTMVNPFAND